MATVTPSAAWIAEVAPLHRFSTAAYLEMIEKGVLGAKDRVELIEGIIVEMSPSGIQHNAFLIRILELLAPLLGTHQVSIQGTLRVAEGHVYDSDVMLLRRRPDRYRTRLPEATDVLLVIEAAESSLRRDQQVKLPVYAAAGIAEYWIADLERELLLIHRQPDGSSYQVVERRQGDETVSPLAAPDLSFSVRAAFN